FASFSGDDEDLEIERVQKILISNGLGANAEEVGRNWVWNCQKLARFWDSDPRKFFAEMQTKPKGKDWSFKEAKANYEAAAVKIMRRAGRSHAKHMSQP